LHKEIFFSNYEINGDSITFFTGVEHFIKYLDWNEEYKYHRKHLDIVDKVSEDILISIPDDILVVEKKEIVQGRFIDNKYYPKYEFIPSMLSEVKKDKLLKLF
jgi:hypothetical protein